MVEDTRLHSTIRTTADSQKQNRDQEAEEEEEEEQEVEALAQVDAGENVRKPGSDAKQGDLVLEKGTVVHAHGGEIGTLAFVGRTKVSIRESTGLASVFHPFGD